MKILTLWLQFGYKSYLNRRNTLLLAWFLVTKRLQSVLFMSSYPESSPGIDDVLWPELPIQICETEQILSLHGAFLEG